MHGTENVPNLLLSDDPQSTVATHGHVRSLAAAPRGLSRMLRSFVIVGGYALAVSPSSAT